MWKEYPIQILGISIIVTALIQQWSSTILVLSLLKYFCTLFLIGISGTCILIYFNKKRFRFKNEQRLKTFIIKFQSIIFFVAALICSLVLLFGSFMTTKNTLSVASHFLISFLVQTISAFLFAILVFVLQVRHSK